MIITRTPFRVSFCGGGSDMECFYKMHEGCVLSTSINKYMYISVHPYFDENKTVLKYSQIEIVNDLTDIRHKIFGHVLKKEGISGAELTSMADVPAGTGLGSSSAFTVGLLNVLSCYKGKYRSKRDLAKRACEVEIDELLSPIGKQDQYAVAMGGMNFITFRKNGDVTVDPIIMERDTYDRLQKNLIMFYTGTTRSADDILKVQKANIENSDKTNNLIKMCKLAKKMKEKLENNDLSAFGDILNQSWELKKTLAVGIANPIIDEKYELAMKNGALGGKLLGAGGGGFLLFYCEEAKQKQLKRAIGLKEFDFKFDSGGTTVIHIGDKYWD